MPFLHWLTWYIARNQRVSGSFEAWKMVPAVSETWRRQVEQ
jgi:hypothetical protein